VISPWNKEQAIRGVNIAGLLHFIEQLEG